MADLMGRLVDLALWGLAGYLAVAALAAVVGVAGAAWIERRRG